MATTTTSNIGLGGLTTTNGQTTLSSTLFGVDINTLVNGLVEAKSVPNTQRQDRIDANTKKLSAYSTLQTKLQAIQTASNALRNPRVTSGLTDVFDAKTTLSQASGTLKASEIFGITATDSATKGSHSLTVNSVAKSDTISGTAVIADSSTAHPVSTSGTLVLNGTNVSLTNTMTLTQVKDAINNLSGTTKVQASIVQASSTDFRLVLKATTTGKAISLTGSTSTVLTDLGLAASGETDTSLSASLVLDGITTTRSTNSVNDLIPGLNIELYQADAGKPVTITVDNNLSGIGDAVTSFITAYNDLVDYVKTQRATTADGTVGEDQVLHNDGLMQSVYRAMQSAVGNGGLGMDSGTLKSLRDIGIDLTKDGKLETSDTTKFENALLDNLDQVKALFGFQGNASSGFEVVDRPDTIPGAIIGQTVTVRVTATDSEGVPTAAEFVYGGTTYAATIKNGFISSDSGDLKGFTVGYSGGVLSGTPYEGTFKPTQGITDQIAGTLTTVLDATSGSLKAAQDTLTDTNTRLTTQISDFKSQLELYRTRLLAQFQAAQQAIQSLESQKSSIISYVNSLNGNN